MYKLYYNENFRNISEYLWSSNTLDGPLSNQASFYHLMKRKQKMQILQLLIKEDSGKYFK